MAHRRKKIFLTMENKEFDLMLQDEDSHWWYKMRRSIVDNYLNAAFANCKRLKLLDLASACGANLLFYDKYGDIYGIDISEKSMEFCLRKGIHNIIRADVHDLPFTAKSFDAVIALDALEHFKDDIAVLKEISRVLKDSGLLIITTPALNILWSQHDEAFCHLRRYSKSALNNKLKEAGFNIEFFSYWLCFIFLPVLIFRKCRDLIRLLRGNNSCARSDFHARPPYFVSFVLNGLAKIEALLIRRKIPMPFGVSLFCVTRKSR